MKPLDTADEESERSGTGGRNYRYTATGRAILAFLPRTRVERIIDEYGLVHGFAGSGVLVVALVSTAPTIVVTLSFLGGSSVLSIVTMAAVSALWGRPIGTRFRRHLKGAAGIVIGALLAGGQLESDLSVNCYQPIDVTERLVVYPDSIDIHFHCDTRSLTQTRTCREKWRSK